MAQTAKKTSPKIVPATTRRTRGDVLRQIAAGTDLKPRQVADVFDVLTKIIAADLGKKGCGEFNFNGLVKLRTVQKPATKARMGRNPFTGEQMMFKASPASRKVRARALRGLNGLL
jgi:nucleoid DNA-binding protein